MENKLGKIEIDYEREDRREDVFGYNHYLGGKADSKIIAGPGAGSLPPTPALPETGREGG